MILLAVALAVYVLLGLAYWLAMAYGLVRTWRGVPRLEEVRPPEPAAWPKLSVIVPACNEADKIEPAMRTLLAEDYPDLEILAVDDRSTDATGDIIDRLAAEDPRVRAIHVKELPAGWLGKVHALDRGFQESRGRFVLFTDADVH
ncbi:MAG: glycosyltransferase, partial [Planctomycetota bacterium]|nr:glycosyltransferase [Planctomycetota bacterium]